MFPQVPVFFGRSLRFSTMVPFLPRMQSYGSNKVQHLRLPQDKKGIALRLARRIRFSARHLPLHLFDIFWRTTLQELEETGTIPSVGLQKAWSSYFVRQYLQVQWQDGVELWNATWRHGPDRPGIGDTSNLVESRHSWIKGKLAQLGQGEGVSKRPELHEVLQRLQDIFRVNGYQNDKPTTSPTYVDPVLLSGHVSLRRNNRSRVKDFVQAHRADARKFVPHWRHFLFFGGYILSLSCFLFCLRPHRRYQIPRGAQDSISLIKICGLSPRSL